MIAQIKGWNSGAVVICLSQEEASDVTSDFRTESRESAASSASNCLRSGGHQR